MKAISSISKTGEFLGMTRATQAIIEGIIEKISILVSSACFGLFTTTPQLTPPKKLRIAAE